MMDEQDVAQGLLDDGEVVEHTGELLRIAVMSRELLGELRDVQLDESGRERLREIYDRTIGQLRAVLPENLEQELDAVTVSFENDASGPELRLAQAQLVGWLEGLFRGIQAAVQTQQLQALAQLQRMRPSGGQPGMPPPQPSEPTSGQPQPWRPGQYL